MEDEGGDHAEGGEQIGCDAGLKADEDSKTGNEFEETGEIGERRCGRPTGTGIMPAVADGSVSLRSRR